MISYGQANFFLPTVLADDMQRTPAERLQYRRISLITSVALLAVATLGAVMTAVFISTIIKGSLTAVEKSEKGIEEDSTVVRTLATTLANLNTTIV